MGYAKAITRLDFPDLSEDDDPIWVEIRNPKTLPMKQLMPEGDLETDADGNPIDRGAATRATFGLLASLVVDWHVYDATTDGPALPVPATAEHVENLPMEIQTALIDQIRQVTPTPR